MENYNIENRMTHGQMLAEANEEGFLREEEACMYSQGHHEGDIGECIDCGYTIRSGEVHGKGEYGELYCNGCGSW